MARIAEPQETHLAKKKTAARTTRTTTDGAKIRSTSEREMIDAPTDKMFAKRRADGTFKEMDDTGRSLSTDRRRTAKKKTKSGSGDQGDRKRAGKKR